MVNFGPIEAQNYTSLYLRIWPKGSMIKTKKFMKITKKRSKKNLLKQILIWAKCVILG